MLQQYTKEAIEHENINTNFETGGKDMGECSKRGNLKGKEVDMIIGGAHLVDRGIPSTRKH